MNAADPLRYQASLQPDQPAIRFAGGELSYRRLDRRVNQVARALLSLGLAKGERVGMLVSNRPEHVEVLYGTARAGLVVVTYDPGAPPAELESAFDGLELRAAVVEERLLPVWRAMQRRLEIPASRTLVVGSGDGLEPSYDAVVETADGEEVFGLAGGDDALTIMRTSGTTGRPKSLLLRHSTYLARNSIHGLVFRVSPSDIALCCLSLHFGAGRGLVFGTLAFGATVLLHEHFDAARALDAIERERVSILSMVPTMYRRILELLDRRRLEGSALRVVLAFGGLLEEGLAERIRSQLTPSLYNHYASTDIGSICVLHPDEFASRPASVGRPVWPLEVRVVGEDGQPLPPGEVGEIQCRGPLVLDGYLEDPLTTAELARTGWLPTGDLGTLASDGYLFLQGRKKNVIKSGGMSVQADEVEQALLLHPSVREAAVFGVPDQEWGERVCAVVVLKDAQEEISVQDLTQHCRAQIAAFKAPKEIHLLERLPYTSLGKIAHQTLRERYGQQPAGQTGSGT